jgi:integrase
MEGTK